MLNGSGFVLGRVVDGMRFNICSGDASLSVAAGTNGFQNKIRPDAGRAYIKLTFNDKGMFHLHKYLDNQVQISVHGDDELKCLLEALNTATKFLEMQLAAYEGKGRGCAILTVDYDGHQDLSDIVHVKVDDSAD